jgi:L-lysine 6-transaminase
MAEHVDVLPSEVHQILGRHVLTDGMKLVVDLKRSYGSRLVDARNGKRYLDLYTFFASAPLGINPPGIVDDPTFMAELAEMAANKPANPDMYTTAYAEFVETFFRVLGDPAMPHLFFIEGGALAVENALKVAFDWKSRHNEATGRDPRLGTKIMHLTKAFHGRSGYTLSLTNTEPNKTDRYPKFDWPRLDVPAITFPLHDHLDEVVAAEQHALDQARRAFAEHPDDIAAFIAEPIQGEGGDNHFRPDFLQAMQALCREHDALFIVDEVQTGVGLTGTAWAYQQFGLEPDVVAFGKKTQVCGIMAGRRVDEVRDNVFELSSRINSTWGGNLTDMVRSRRILEVIERDGLIERAKVLGDQLIHGLHALAGKHPMMQDVRGRGLMCAFTLPSAEMRNDVLARLRVDERVLMLGCGPSSVRVRPALTVTSGELERGLAALDRVLSNC